MPCFGAFEAEVNLKVRKPLSQMPRPEHLRTFSFVSKSPKGRKTAVFAKMTVSKKFANLLGLIKGSSNAIKLSSVFGIFKSAKGAWARCRSELSVSVAKGGFAPLAS
jgi:hypothetical protein